MTRSATVSTQLSHSRFSSRCGEGANMRSESFVFADRDGPACWIAIAGVESRKLRMIGNDHWIACAVVALLPLSARQLIVPASLFSNEVDCASAAGWQLHITRFLCTLQSHPRQPLQARWRGQRISGQPIPAVDRAVGGAAESSPAQPIGSC